MTTTTVRKVRLTVWDYIFMVVLAVSVVMSYMSFAWAAAFAGSGTVADAVTNVRSGSDTALIIAAVMTPVSTLQGYIFKVAAERSARK